MENMKIAAAMLAAQRSMTAAAKSAENPHFKNKYADLASIIEAVKGPLNDAGIVFFQSCTNDATGVMVATTLMHESGEYLSERIYLPVPQQTPQAYGSAITYAKRYQLQSMCGLPSEDDDGNEGSMKTPKNRALDNARPNTATQVAVDEFAAMPPDAQAIIREWAMEIIADVEGGNVSRALSIAQTNCKTHEDQLALSSQLPSHVRSKMKAAKAKQPSVAEQAIAIPQDVPF